MTTASHRHKWRYGDGANGKRLTSATAPGGARRVCRECQAVQVKASGNWRTPTAHEQLEHYARFLENLDHGEVFADWRERNDETWVGLRSNAYWKYREAQDEVELEEAREADNAARRAKPSIVHEPDGSILASIIVHVEEDRRSHFDRPNCGKQVNVRNVYPFTWRWKTCPGCRLMWVNANRWSGSIGLHADKAVGLSRVLEVLSSGKPR